MSRVTGLTIVMVLIGMIVMMEARLGLKRSQQGKTENLQLPGIQERGFHWVWSLLVSVVVLVEQNTRCGTEPDLVLA